jgi:hypothetical protein
LVFALQKIFLTYYENNHVTWRHQMEHFVSASSQGCKCRICGAPATHKVGEEIANDDPSHGLRHNYTAYVCCEHFHMIFGEAVLCPLPEKK